MSTLKHNLSFITQRLLLHAWAVLRAIVTQQNTIHKTVRVYSEELLQFASSQLYVFILNLLIRLIVKVKNRNVKKIRSKKLKNKILYYSVFRVQSKSSRMNVKILKH